MQQQTNNWREQGFTLIEIMVVIVILGIMAAVVVPNILSKPDEARVTVAQTDLRSISNALEMYKLEHYDYPSTAEGLKALTLTDDGTNAILKKVPIDPWGNPYQYLYPGAQGDGFDLYSLGSDGKKGGKGTAADIGNRDM